MDFTVPATSVGFEVPAPIGTGCTATFDYVGFQAGTLADLRDGS